MSYFIKKKSYFSKGLACLVMFALLFSTLGLIFPQSSKAYAQEWAPEKEEPILVVTGEGIGITNERSYTLKELTSMNQVTNLYSTINTTPTTSIYLGKGVKVSELL